MNNLWIILSILSLIISAIGIISLKYLNKLSNINSNIIFAITFIIMGLISIIYLLYNKYDFFIFTKNCNNKLLFFIFFLSFLLIFNNIIMKKALDNSPNIGYCHMIINLNVIITLLASYFIFHEKINKFSLFGIIITLLGIFIMLYYSNN